MRTRLAIGHDFALFDGFTFEHADFDPLRHQDFRLGAVGTDDLDALLALGARSELDRAGGFGEHRRFLGLAGFEQIGDARQTARDVARLRCFLRDTCDRAADAYFFAVPDRTYRPERESVV